MKTFLLLASLALIGVSVYFRHDLNPGPDPERCVDYQDRVVAYSFCTLPTQTVKVPGSINPEPRYRLYYGGNGGQNPGDTAWGGSDYPLTGHVYEPVGRDQPPAAAENIAGSEQPYVAAH